MQTKIGFFLALKKIVLFSKLCQWPSWTWIFELSSLFSFYLMFIYFVTFEWMTSWLHCYRFTIKSISLYNRCVWLDQSLQLTSGIGPCEEDMTGGVWGTELIKYAAQRSQTFTAGGPQYFNIVAQVGRRPGSRKPEARSQKQSVSDGHRIQLSELLLC